MNHLRTTVIKRVGYITLSRPEKRNALNDQMVVELDSAFSQMASRDDVKVIVLEAEGNAFCAGADLEYLLRLRDYDHQQNLEDSKQLRDLLLKIFKLEKVVIAKVQGPAIAGGAGLVSVCDFSFASEAAKIGYTEVRIGFVPAIVMPFLLNKVDGHYVRQLLLSGQIISAKQALDIGLFYRVLAIDDLHEAVTEFAEDLCQKNSTKSMGITKRLLYETGSSLLGNSLDIACQYNAESRATDDFAQGISDFLAKKDRIW